MRVLLTGATGYVGRRLLERPGPGTRHIDLRLFVRNAAKVELPPGKKIEIVEGSSFDPEALRRGLPGDVTRLIISSTRSAPGKDFGGLERRSAENFRDACAEEGVGRIIYLGGLGAKATASEHLRSRIETGEILSARPDRVRTLWFRAGVVIGSGSASFEIIRNLVQKLPGLDRSEMGPDPDRARRDRGCGRISARRPVPPPGREHRRGYRRRGDDVPGHASRRRPSDGAPAPDHPRSALLARDCLPTGSSCLLPFRTGSPAPSSKGLKSETVVAQRRGAHRPFRRSSPPRYCSRPSPAALEEIEHHQVVSRGATAPPGLTAG